MAIDWVAVWTTLGALATLAIFLFSIIKGGEGLTKDEESDIVSKNKGTDND